MTVQTSTNVASFNGDGANKVFPIGYKFNSAADLVVTLIDDDAKTTRILTLNSDFTVAGAGDEEGGAVTLTVAPTNVQRLKVTRVVDILQLTDLRNQGKSYAEIHEDAFDLLTMIAQQQNSTLKLALRVAESDEEPAPLPTATNRANLLLSFDSSGNPIAVAPVSGDATDLAINLANDADASKGSGQVGFKRTDLAAAITTVGGMLSAQWRNIWEFAGLITSKPDVLDPSTWDWLPAAQALVDSGAGIAYFPPITGGVYKTSGPVIVDANIRLVGQQAKRLGATVGTRIENTGAGDTIVYSNTDAIYDAGIENLGITSTTGHAINIKYGAVRCSFKQLYLYTKATNKSCVAGLYNAGVAGTDYIGTYSCIFEGGEYIVDNVARTAPIIDFLANGTYVNENTFRNLWITNSNGRAAVRMMCVTAGSLLTNNCFDGVTFEVCSGGLIALQATSHTRITGCSAWDTTAGYDGSLILVSGDTAVTQTRGLLIENFARVGNALNGTAVDIDLGYSADTTIINHSTTTGGKIDCRSRTAAIIGAPSATITGDGSVTYLRGGSITSTEFATKAGNKVRDLSGGADIHAPAGTAGLSAVNSGNTQRVYLDANTFFGGNGALLPSTDNLLNLGHTSNRFKTIYAGTGTINTSDAREKREVRELSEAERAVAVRLKGLLRCFKFNDAVEQKGDGARIHCGVIAQDVKAAFEAEGLVAERYALLCYDEWPEQAEVATDEGEVVTPSRAAGNRYGVRYEELLAFIISAL